jgi:hypothetical protein
MSVPLGASATPPLSGSSPSPLSGSSPFALSGSSPEGPGGIASPGDVSLGTGAGDSGGAGAGGALESSMAQAQAMNLYYLQVQEEVNAQNRTFTALSNVLEVEHNTAKSAIGNIH